MNNPFPVVLGICLDAEAIWLGINPDNIHRPAHLSHGTYEIHEGLAPMLDLLDAHGVASTFFVPGITAERYPDAVREIHRRGHEIASHGWSHRSIVGMAPEQEVQELVSGINLLHEITGERPTTWRSASWDWTVNTLDILLDHGVQTSTNFHDRLRPYRHAREGQPVALVELPVQWHLADAPYFIHGGRMERVLRTAAEVETLWREEFDGLYDWPGTFFHLTLHPQLIAHPGRLRMLDRFLHHMKSRPRTRFMRCDELAHTVA
jgi:peptidoglycan/xylan/chitin deacetylase (PgdA/CDA1 family)